MNKYVVKQVIGEGLHSQRTRKSIDIEDSVLFTGSYGVVLKCRHKVAWFASAARVIMFFGEDNKGTGRYQEVQGHGR